MGEHRRKHPRRGCELLLQLAEDGGWEIQDSGGPSVLLICPCTDDYHWGWVSMEPTDPNYTGFVNEIIRQCATWRRDDR